MYLYFPSFRGATVNQEFPGAAIHDVIAQEV